MRWPGSSPSGPTSTPASSSTDAATPRRTGGRRRPRSASSSGTTSAADLGIAPTRLDDFTATSLSTKVFEYAALRKPVVASRLPLVERTFGADTVVTYPSGDPAAMAAVIIRLADDEDDRRGRVERAAARVAELGWAAEADRYAAIVDGLDRHLPGTAAGGSTGPLERDA